jgi:hypothetical protein
MECQGSKLSVQEPTTESYPEPAEFTPHTHALFKKSIVIYRYLK